MNLPIKNILEDRNNILGAWDQIEKMCERTKRPTDITHYDMLLARLKIKRHYFLQEMQELLDDATTFRQRRGLFGTLLMNVFGVNDELYEGIDALKYNQQNILPATTQQAMLINGRITHSNLIIKDMELR